MTEFNMHCERHERKRETKRERQGWIGCGYASEGTLPKVNSIIARFKWNKGDCSFDWKQMSAEMGLAGRGGRGIPHTMERPRESSGSKGPGEGVCVCV